MATRFRFTKDYDHSIRFGVDKAYKKGTEDLIPEAHAEAAEKAGVGHRIADKAPAAPKTETAPKAAKG